MFVNIINKGEVYARATAARARFEEDCARKYGYVPFGDEYFERNWPETIPSPEPSVPEVRDHT